MIRIPIADENKKKVLIDCPVFDCRKKFYSIDQKIMHLSFARNNNDVAFAFGGRVAGIPTFSAQASTIRCEKMTIIKDFEVQFGYNEKLSRLLNAHEYARFFFLLNNEESAITRKLDFNYRSE